MAAPAPGLIVCLTLDVELKEKTVKVVLTKGNEGENKYIGMEYIIEKNKEFCCLPEDQ